MVFRSPPAFLNFEAGRLRRPACQLKNVGSPARQIGTSAGAGRMTCHGLSVATVCCSLFTVHCSLFTTHPRSTTAQKQKPLSSHGFQRFTIANFSFLHNRRRGLYVFWIMYQVWGRNAIGKGENGRWLMDACPESASSGRRDGQCIALE